MIIICVSFVLQQNKPQSEMLSWFSKKSKTTNDGNMDDVEMNMDLLGPKLRKMYADALVRIDEENKLDIPIRFQNTCELIRKAIQHIKDSNTHLQTYHDFCLCEKFVYGTKGRYMKVRIPIANNDENKELYDYFLTKYRNNTNVNIYNMKIMIYDSNIYIEYYVYDEDYPTKFSDQIKNGPLTSISYNNNVPSNYKEEYKLLDKEFSDALIAYFDRMYDTVVKKEVTDMLINAATKGINILFFRPHHTFYYNKLVEYFEQEKIKYDFYYNDNGYQRDHYIISVEMN